MDTHYPGARGAVVVFACAGCDSMADHESATLHELAARLAAIKGYSFEGVFDAGSRYAGPLYFVPNTTLVIADLARGLEIHGEEDLFGGVVPFGFVGTKVITHPLPVADAVAPPGWSHDFGRRVIDVVVPGFSAFSLRDARHAGARLLERGSVRIKKASGIGGHGQSLAASMDELDARLQSIGAEELSCGVVLERNLRDVKTYSVGQVRVGKLLATYYGTQRLTVDNNGEEVYGGSDLVVARGDFDALMRLPMDRDVQTAVAQARAYHAAAVVSFPGMFVSRCNYDIAQGYDDEGLWRSGVLEQSWRAGGASGAELAALEAFHRDPELAAVCASTTEVYGAGSDLPSDAVVYFRGIDEQVGAITKYSRLEPYTNP